MTELRRRRRLDAATRRAEIVDAAAQVFGGRDPHDVTFEEIAHAAGVSRALVYNYFGDKGDLLAAVHLRSLHRLHESLREAGPDGVDERSLVGLVRTYLEFAESDPEAFRNLVDTEVSHHPEVRAARRRRLERMAAAWGDTAEARVAASGVLGMLEGATRQWLEERDRGSDITRVAEILVELVRGGMPAGTGSS